MSFQQSLEQGYVKQVPPGTQRARSLQRSAEEALLTVNEIHLKEQNYKSIIRELYEALRQYCEAIGYIRGYKFLSHEVITYFPDEILHENTISTAFDRYRKLRNGINYYGRDVSQETVEKALTEIPNIIKKLQKYTF